MYLFLLLMYLFSIILLIFIIFYMANQNVTFFLNIILPP